MRSLFYFQRKPVLITWEYQLYYPIRATVLWPKNFLFIVLVQSPDTVMLIQYVGKKVTEAQYKIKESYAHHEG